MNDLFKMRWQKFTKNYMAYASLWFLAIFMIFSFSAEIWSNSKPLILRFAGETYFPIFKNYKPSSFHKEEIILDYRSLELTSSDWAIWPVNRWDPLESNSKLSSYPAPPSRENWFGTDDRGRDIFSRLLYGARSSLVFSLGVWFLSYLLGVIFGVLMGYLGGWVDLIAMRIIEIFESVPEFLLLLTLIAIFTPSMQLLILFSVFFGWMNIAVYMRTEVLALRKREFVTGARAIGASNIRIIFLHILPNAVTPIITFAPFKIASNILVLANMEYLGLGLPAPTPSWGELLNQASHHFMVAEWLVWWPSIFIILTMFLLIQIGLGVRDAYDTKINF